MNGFPYNPYELLVERRCRTWTSDGTESEGGTERWSSLSTLLIPSGLVKAWYILLRSWIVWKGIHCDYASSMFGGLTGLGNLYRTNATCNTASWIHVVWCAFIHCKWHRQIYFCRLRLRCNLFFSEGFKSPNSNCTFKAEQQLGDLKSELWRTYGTLGIALSFTDREIRMTQKVCNAERCMSFHARCRNKTRKNSGSDHTPWRQKQCLDVLFSAFAAKVTRTTHRTCNDLNSEDQHFGSIVSLLSCTA